MNQRDKIIEKRIKEKEKRINYAMERKFIEILSMHSNQCAIALLSALDKKPKSDKEIEEFITKWSDIFYQKTYEKIKGRLLDIQPILMTEEEKEAMIESEPPTGLEEEVIVEEDEWKRAEAEADWLAEQRALAGEDKGEFPDF